MRIAGSIAGAAAGFLPPPFNIIAAAASVALNVGASLLQKKPPVLGSPNQIRIGSNNPSPYPMGRTFTGGTMVHDVGYGPTVDGVPNPYRSMVIVGSRVGPIEGYEAFQADYATIPFSGGNAVGYYHNFLYLASQLGLCPEPAALAGPFGAIPSWSAAHKLSGCAAWLTTLRDDKEGKHYASGVPGFGMVARWVLVYDPRQDSTYPGGSGACRVADEPTYVGGEAAENPGCHGVTYAIGRWQNGVKVMGVGFARPDVPAASPAEAAAAIDWPAWVEFANVCTVNGWKVGGVVFEPGSRWDNLKRICAAGGGRPAWVGGKLTVLFSRPRVALDTISSGDVAGDIRIRAMRSWKDRKNVLVPEVRLEAQKWQHVQIDEVRSETYIAEDGEEKSEVLRLELVQQADQGAELAAYDLVNRREMGPITILCKPRLIEYKPGDALYVDIPEEELDNRLCVITKRRILPGGKGQPPTVELTLFTETDEKHDFALGRTGTAPATPSLVAGEDMDAAAHLVRDAGFIQDTPPVGGQSVPGAHWLDSSDGYRAFVRVAGSGLLSIGADRILIGGDAIALAWTEASDQRLRDAYDIATEALASATEAIAALDDLDDDGILTVDEKIRILIPRAAQLEEAWFNLDALAGELGVAAERAAAADARDDWLALLGAITPDWDDTSAPSPVARADYDGLLQAYGEALDALRLKIARASVVVQWSPDGSTSWGTFTSGDRYMRISTDGGLTFGAAMLAIGEDGGTGNLKQHVFKRAATAPATPSGNGIPSGWSDGPPADDGNPLFMSVAEQTAAAVLVGSWSSPIRLDGFTGNYRDIIFIRSLGQPATPTGDNPSGWSDGVPAGTETLWSSTATKIHDGTLVGSWSTPQSLSGLTPRGPFSLSDTYFLNNTVQFGGGSYIALQDNFDGEAPTGTGQANAYWDVLAAPGDTGAPATAPGAFTDTIDLAASTGAVNLRSIADAEGYTGHSDATVTFRVPNGVTIRGLAGGFGIDTGIWPAGHSITLALVVQSGGTVDGGGGNGGNGGGANGTSGGDAIYCRVPCTVTIDSGGTVRGGGGGGGGGATTSAGKFGGGGGGGGAPNGAGGEGYAGDNTTGADGSGGSTSGGGAGGAPGGGAGAGFGAAGGGSSNGGGGGGAGGYAVRKNGHTVTVTNNGSMTGTAA
jgi:hypothetical protein